MNNVHSLYYAPSQMNITVEREIPPIRSVTITLGDPITIATMRGIMRKNESESMLALQILDSIGRE